MALRFFGGGLGREGFGFFRELRKAGGVFHRDVGQHFAVQLDASGFLKNPQKRPTMVRNIRHFFQRGEVTEQELRTLHGIVTELAIGRRQMGRLEDAD